MGKVSYVGAKCMCPMGGYAIFHSTPQSKVMCEKGLILVEGASGTCSYETHGVLYATPSVQNVKIEGRRVLCAGDRTSCGGYIQDGSDVVNVS